MAKARRTTPKTTKAPKKAADTKPAPPPATGNPLSEFLTVACTGTGQSTFYNTREEQEAALEAVHTRLLGADRRLYGLAAALPVNDRSRQLICRNLLANGKNCLDTALEGHVLSMVLDDMQFNRVLNMMDELRANRVNCSRVRKLGRFIWDQVDDFRAIKYTGKLRTMLRHCHVPDDKDKSPARAELWHFVFGNLEDPEKIQHNPKLASRLRAKGDYAALFDLPMDIARDLAVAHHGKTADEFEREFVGSQGKKGKGQTTRKETMIARQKSVKAAAADETKREQITDVDFSRFSLTELLQHGYRNPADRPLVSGFITGRAKELAQGISLPPKVAVLVDNSRSMLGSKERLYWPLVVTSSLLAVFQNSDSEVHVHYTGPTAPGSYFIHAEGDTCLRRPLVEALLTRPDALVILSDGYENVAAGSASQILHSRAVRDTNIHVIHLNPVVASESGARGIRRLSDNLNAYALSSIEQMGAIAMLALAAQDQHALDGMFAQIEQALRLGDYRKAKQIGHKLLIPALEAAK